MNKHNPDCLLEYMHRTRFAPVSEKEFYDSFERCNFFGCVPCDKLPLDEDFHHAVELTDDLTGDISMVAEFTQSYIWVAWSTSV